MLKTWDEGSLVTQIKSTVFGTDLGAVTTVLSGKERRSKKRSFFATQQDVCVRQKRSPACTSIGVTKRRSGERKSSEVFQAQAVPSIEIRKFLKRILLVICLVMIDIFSTVRTDFSGFHSFSFHFFGKT